MVHFVGAGPGDPDLITVKGKKLLEQADVVIYAGSLVNPEVLNWTKKPCRVYNSAHMNLEEVMAVIKEADSRNLQIVRLHTGDPSVYSTIKEQMEQLEKEHIAYDVTPGVSAFQASAAALDAELTLPGISQSVILTRAGGRTKVPERESVQSFAAHRATMALYLSSAYADDVQKQLLAGGYMASTPVDVVYKASWPEQKIVRSDLGHFPEAMEEENITKTALILVGDVLAEHSSNHSARALPEKSKLYDPDFTTGYRKAERNQIVLISCSLHGTENMYTLKRALQNRYPRDEVITFVKCRAHRDNTELSLHEIVRSVFDRALLIVFFASTGIAVRSVARFLRSKATDPAVLTVDEAGKYCIPVLSGHLGGGNDYAREVASILNAEPVITTASDLQHRFAIDVFAKKNGLRISSLKRAKELEARIVAGEEIRLFSDYPVEGRIPEGILMTDQRELADVVVTAKDGTKGDDWKKDGKPCSRPEPLYLVPRNLDIGIGSRRNIPEEAVETAVRRVLKTNEYFFEAIRSISSIDLKKDEKGILAFAGKIGITPAFYTAGQLLTAENEGGFSESEFVRKTTGVGDVCERAAVMRGGRLVIRKVAESGVTVAAALVPVSLHYD